MTVYMRSVFIAINLSNVVFIHELSDDVAYLTDLLTIDDNVERSGQLSEWSGDAVMLFT